MFDSTYREVEIDSRDIWICCGRKAHCFIL